MKNELLVALVYLWSRDAKMSVSPETEKEIIAHFNFGDTRIPFSDSARELMARRIVGVLRNNPVFSRI